jgi:dTDP-4-dehydrorhamnose reductase
LRILLTGINGQLGWELQRELACLGEIISFNGQNLNLANGSNIKDTICQIHPQIIINAAAFTNVELAESHPDLAYEINAEAISNIIEASDSLGCAIIHFSTDYVFDGLKQKGYTEQDTPRPLNIYGKSKLAGENFLLRSSIPFWVFRTSWLYSLRRDNFVLKVLSWAHSQEKVSIVGDQFGSPTWARLLAEITAQSIAMGRNDPINWIDQTKGIYHVAGDGNCSKYEFAKQIINFDPDRAKQRLTELQSVKTADFLSNVSRPSFSGLDCTLFKQKFNLSLPSWQKGLKMMLEI